MKAVSESLGHSSLSITADTYTTVLPEVARATAEAVAGVTADGDSVAGSGSGVGGGGLPGGRTGLAEGRTRSSFASLAPRSPLPAAAIG